MLAPSFIRESGLSSLPSPVQPRLTLIEGDVVEGALDPIADRSIQTVITSPPYFGVPRDYLPLGSKITQLGVEHSFSGYKESLLTALAYLQPKMAKDGWVWVNLGDSFFSRRGCGPQGKNGIGNHTIRQGGVTERIMEWIGDGTKNKDIVGVPFQIAMAASKELGYFWRASVPWVKIETYGESVADRPVVSVEWFIGLAVGKTAKYDRLSVRVPGKTQDLRMRRTGDWFFDSLDLAIEQQAEYLEHLKAVRSGERQLLVDDNLDPLAVVAMPGGYAGHKAAFPERLILPFIDATTDPDDLVADIFAGSCTTGAAALRRGRRALMFDAKREYLELGLNRIREEIGEVEVSYGG
jgi:hypothetical protein